MVEVETVVDTGFAGFLTVPPALLTQLVFVTNGWVKLADGGQTMTNRMADEMLERLDTTCFYPVPYWSMDKGGWELTVPVGGSA